MVLSTDIIREGQTSRYRNGVEATEHIAGDFARARAQMVLQAIRNLESQALIRIEELATEHGAVLTGYRLLEKGETALATDERWSATAWGWVPATPCIIQADMGPVRRLLV